MDKKPSGRLIEVIAKGETKNGRLWPLLEAVYPDYAVTEISQYV